MKHGLIKDLNSIYDILQDYDLTKMVQSMDLCGCNEILRDYVILSQRILQKMIKPDKSSGQRKNRGRFTYRRVSAQAH
ncbi:hypothetical protein [Thermoanaerobacterium sp. DL9XJH110]|uniref:hypothetical protein n=1 Tax=Thermoanaerobacterium sp. DL9XJH110 TaxID=3386643 RepID=UPI003BB7EA98